MTARCPKDTEGVPEREGGGGWRGRERRRQRISDILGGINYFILKKKYYFKRFSDVLEGINYFILFQAKFSVFCRHEPRGFFFKAGADFLFFFFFFFPLKRHQRHEPLQGRGERGEICRSAFRWSK
jgi:hypothetical protein